MRHQRLSAVSFATALDILVDLVRIVCASSSTIRRQEIWLSVAAEESTATVPYVLKTIVTEVSFRISKVRSEP